MPAARGFDSALPPYLPRYRGLGTRSYDENHVFSPLLSFLASHHAQSGDPEKTMSVRGSRAPVVCVGVGGLWVLHIPGKQGTGEIYGGGWGVGGPLRGCGARLTLFWSSARPPHQGGWNVVTGRAGGVQGVEGVMLRVAVGAVTWQGARRCPLDYLGVLYGCQPDGLQYWRSLEGGGGM